MHRQNAEGNATQADAEAVPAVRTIKAKFPTGAFFLHKRWMRVGMLNAAPIKLDGSVNAARHRAPVSASGKQCKQPSAKELHPAEAGEVFARRRGDEARHIGGTRPNGEAAGPVAYAAFPPSFRKKRRRGTTDRCIWNFTSGPARGRRR